MLKEVVEDLVHLEEVVLQYKESVESILFQLQGVEEEVEMEILEV
jgi:hypothetical protein